MRQTKVWQLTAPSVITIVRGLASQHFLPVRALLALRVLPQGGESVEQAAGDSCRQQPLAAHTVNPSALCRPRRIQQELIT
jgi:hypothetical protein